MEIIDPTKYPEWDKLLLSTPGSGFFHTFAWAEVLKKAYGYTPMYFTELKGDRISSLIAIMEIRSFLTGCRAVSLPFADYCEPIIGGNGEFIDILNIIVECGRERGWKYIELRGGSSFLIPQCATLDAVSMPTSREVNADPLFDVRPSEVYLGHTLRLCQDEKELFSRFRDGTRRNIRKAIKEGVEVKINGSHESIKEFYRLNAITRKRHGLPPQPFSFFEEIYGKIISMGHGFVALATYKNQTIAGGAYFHFGEKGLFKYGASDPRYQHLRANNLVMWEAIRWYSQKGYKSLCFGRTEPENLGLIQFKLGWRPTEERISYYHYDLRKNAFTIAPRRMTGFHNRIFRNMPTSLLRQVGSLLYRHTG